MNGLKKLIFSWNFPWLIIFSMTNQWRNMLSSPILMKSINHIIYVYLQIIGYCCALEAFILATLAFYPSCRRRFRRSSSGDDHMGLHDRELSPLSSNDLGDKMYRSKANDLPNHYNKSMKRSVTDTIRDHEDNDSDMPTIMIQKTSYTPSELTNELNL